MAGNCSRSRRITRFKEQLDALAPSESWFTRHPTGTFNLLAFGFGSAIELALGYATRTFKLTPPPLSPFVAALVAIPLVGLTLSWWYRWLFGAFPGVVVRDWIVKAWPVIDLDVGPEQMRREKMQRARIATFIAAGVVPLAVTIFYDIARHVVSGPAK